MENKKLTELKTIRPSKEEQVAFVDELIARSKKRQEELRIWTENLKKKYGLNDEID